MANTKVATFTERLNYLISQFGKSANRISIELGVTRSAMSSWQNGVREPRRPMMDAIARYFDVDISWLLGYDTAMRFKVDIEPQKPSPPPEPQNEKITILARAARRLSDDDQKKLYEIARIMFRKEFEEAEKEK